ncbi:MAG: ATP-binding cassette domain-containing protein [Lachnospiraceae bacterium]|nr:ATP-binding cassette domain-containing protein [Lachnospiraceae bacterium]
MAEKKLSVKNLRISFRTSNGKVQAVRDISFDLYKGETLAIVGESGSGKSVTSKAIMGISAGNAVVENGKILYGDKDLLKISEEEFHEIRGDKIAMVFQDPLSSLNPIMRIGKQLTEAMILKNRTARKESRKDIKDMLEAVESKMLAAGVIDAGSYTQRFREMEKKHTALESEYTDALDFAKETSARADNLLVALQNSREIITSADIKEFANACKGSVSRFVVNDRADEMLQLAGSLNSLRKEAAKSRDRSKLIKAVTTAKEIADEAIALDTPNTFTLGCYQTFVNGEIPKTDSISALNELTRKEADKAFLTDFIDKVKMGVARSIEETDANRAAAIEELEKELPAFEAEELNRNVITAAAKRLKPVVGKCINPLEVVKDSITHTFGSSIDYAIDKYYDGIENNRKETVRYEKQKRKYDALVAKGKKPEWSVVPAGLVDIDVLRRDMADVVKELIAHLKDQLAANREIDVDKRTLEVIDFMKETEQRAAYKVTKSGARERAIKLMESVGIDNPRRRYRQYPFEFSGGMRQRIVIAIALTANPDVLICDEPTTALDVTIQAQILELINQLKEERQLSVIFITHDLGVVANMADRIAVMYAGKIVEYGTARDVFYSPAHPYTWALLSSVPDLDTKEKLESIPGTPPNMIYPPKGDAFADRNKYALEIDFEEQPPMFKISDTHYAATWLLHPNAPKVDPPKVVLERINKMKEKRGESDE